MFLVCSTNIVGVPDIVMNNIHLIDDAPSAVDEFEGGAHGRVATALVDIITTADGGKAIGLEGSWGSGKSTVIDIAGTKLSEFDKTSDRRHVLFLFDTWAHQGDPILRVFLDELITRLHAIGAVDNEYWKLKLEKLRSRRKKITETKAKKLTWPACVALLVVPLLPGAYILLQKVASFWWDAGAIALISLPYISIALTWLSWRNWNRGEGRWYEALKDKRDQSVLWAFTNQTDQEVTDQLIREEEATTIEFNEVFDELVRNASSKSNKLVIVLDNLDRLPANLIRDIWAVMRNFFAASPNSGRQSTLLDVWLVVPFDREHIETVFAQDGHKKSGDQIAPGFIEKTFEIVLRVSPPLVSNWKAYLRTKLNDALGNSISDAQAYQIFKLFDLNRLTQTDAVTPRQIKSYVNSIAAQIKQWGDTIPAQYQALFVLNRAKISQNISTLQQSSLLDARTMRYVEDWEWQKYLAAAHFNVDPEAALELLLGQEIERALADDKAGALEKLQATSGFEIILHSTIMDKIADWTKSDPISLFKISETIAKLSLNDSATRAEIWKRLGNAVAGIDQSLDDQGQIRDGLVALVENSSDSDCRRVVRAILSALEISVDEGSEDGEVFYSLIETLKNVAGKRLSEDVITKLFSDMTLDGTPSRVFSVAEESMHGKELSFASFKPVRTPAELSAALVEHLKSPELENWVGECVSGLLEKPATVTWASVVTTIRDRLQTRTPTNSPATSRQLLDILRNLLPASKKSATEALTQLSTTGSLHGLVEIGNAAKDQSLVSDALFEIIIQKKSDLAGPNEHPQYGSLQAANALLQDVKSNPAKYPDIVTQLADLAGKNDAFTEFFTLATTGEKANELFRAVLRSMVEKQNYTSLSILTILNSFAPIEGVLGSTLTEKFAKRFSDWKIGKYVEGESWKDISPEYLTLSSKLGTTHSRVLIEGLEHRFSELSGEQWLEVFKQEDNRLDLLFALFGVSGSIRFESAYFDALKQYAEQFLDEEEKPSSNYEWATLPAFLNTSWKSPFYDWLRDRVLERSLNSEALTKIFDHYGNDFARLADFSSRPDDVTRNIIDPLLTNPKADALACVNENAKEFRKILAKAGTNEREMISKRLGDILNGPEASDETKTLVSELALSLDVSLPKKEEAEPEPDSEATKEG
jgi:hypothetical protein